MSVVQIDIKGEMEKRVKYKSKRLGLSKAAYFKVLVARDTGMLDEDDDFTPGNIFNADRDNNGVGITLDEFKNMIVAADNG